MKMSIETDLTHLSDYLHKAQGLIEVILQKLGATGFTPPQPLSTPVAQSMTELPDVSSIQWTVGKGDEKYEARPTDPNAWAFVYTYDRDLRKSTNEVRPECEALVTYLEAHENKLELEGFSYSISQNTVFLNRNKLE